MLTAKSSGFVTLVTKVNHKGDFPSRMVGSSARVSKIAHTNCIWFLSLFAGKSGRTSEAIQFSFILSGREREGKSDFAVVTSAMRGNQSSRGIVNRAPSGLEKRKIRANS